MNREPACIVRDVLSGIASFGRSYQDVEHMKGVRPSTSLVERWGRSEKAEESRRRLKKYESKQKQALNSLILSVLVGWEISRIF